MTTISNKLVTRYGNFNSAILAQTLPKPDAKVGDEATILHGRDREPAKISKIEYAKNGNVKGYWLQPYKWEMDPAGEGHAKVIHWNMPEGASQFFPVVTRGKLKGTVKDAFIGVAQPFYDRSF
jgi:hypothetical protein